MIFALKLRFVKTDYFGIDAKIVFMERYLTKYIKADLDKKIILLTGPRQTGKTTLSKMLRDDFDYFNYDNVDDRLGLQERSWDALRKKWHTEDELIDTTIFKREIRFKKKGAPLTSIDDVIDAAYLTVKDNYAPAIAIVGANNEEAIQAAKRANEEGRFRLAKFVLLGDFQEINRIAYEYDLVIDNENYTIVDTENPIDKAIELLDEGKVQFQYLKRML